MRLNELFSREFSAFSYLDSQELLKSDAHLWNFKCILTVEMPLRK